MAGNQRTPLAQRFARFVQKADDPSGCWLWTGSMCNHYGQIGNGADARPLLAHRASWLITHGPIPDGLYVLHRCDNGRCVNPAHLFLGTQRQNIHDMIAKGRDRITGERAHQAILTSDQVREIRRSTESARVIAKRLGVAFQTISDVRRRKNWKHVT
jgi:hypothetical protein